MNNILKKISIKSIAKKVLPDCVIRVLKKIKKNIIEYKNKIIIEKIYKKNLSIENKLRNRGDKQIRFACYVMYASDFGESDIISLMIADKDFSPKIVIVPDVARGKDHMLSEYHETKEFLINKFGSEYILDGYNEETDTYLDYSNNFDIIAMNCPYDEMYHKVHKISYLNKKNLLVIHSVYGYFISKFGETVLYPRLEISCLWKMFLDTKYTYNSYAANSICKGKNAVALGYPKMDALSRYKCENKNRKQILIAPHHSVNSPKVPLSNFLSYYDLILELPELYPSIDFVFRPHPLLFSTLINAKLWTKEQVDTYLNDLSRKGIIYSHGGDYFDVFANSDAIIHDCASYITEWLFTGKPGCFVVKDDSIFNTFTELGKESVKYYKFAYSREDIIDFINNVIDNKINNNNFNNSVIKENIMLNYPNVSQKIVDYLRLK